MATVSGVTGPIDTDDPGSPRATSTWVTEARHGAEVQEQRRRVNPDGYNLIPRYVLPRLKEMGASDADIHQITVENARRFFAGNRFEEL